MSEKPDVDGKDLLQRGLDLFFNKLGDTIHGATEKKESKAAEPEATSKDDKKTIETDGTEVSPEAPATP